MEGAFWGLPRLGRSPRSRAFEHAGDHYGAGANPNSALNFDFNYIVLKGWGAANGGLRDGGLRKSEDI